MKKILCLLFFVSGYFAYAQDRFIDLDTRSEKLQTYSYASNDNLVYFIREKNILHVLVYDSTYSLVKQSKYNLEEFINKSEGVLSVSEMNDMPSLFFGDNKLSTFSSLSLDLITYDIKQYTYPKLPRANYYLNSFSSRGRFYVLCFSDTEKPCFILKEYPGDGTVTDHTIPLTDLPINKGIWDDLSKVFFDENSTVKRMRCDEPTDNVTAGALIKLYANDSSMYITLNNECDTTQIIKVSLVDYKTTFRKIPSGNPICKKDKRMRDNSFLTDGKLFYAAACYDHLVFKIFNVETGEMLKEFIVNSTDEISFKNGRLHKTVADKEKNHKMDTKDFLTKLCFNMVDVNLGVGVNPLAKDEYDITIGASRNLQAPTSPYMVMPFYFAPPTPGPPPSFGGFRMLLPALAFSEGLASISTSYENYFFKTCLRKDDLSFVSKPDTEDKYQLLRDKVNHINEAEDTRAITAIRFKGKVVVSYFHVFAKRFFITVTEF